MKTKGKPRFLLLFYLPELRKLETIWLEEDLVTAFHFVFTCFSRLPFSSSFSHTVAQHVGPCESSVTLSAGTAAIMDCRVSEGNLDKVPFTVGYYTEQKTYGTFSLEEPKLAECISSSFSAFPR